MAEEVEVGDEEEVVSEGEVEDVVPIELYDNLGLVDIFRRCWKR